jgi:hypothetical protein
MTHFCDIYCRLGKIISKVYKMLRTTSDGSTMRRVPSLVIGLLNSDMRKFKLKSVNIQVIILQVAKTETWRKFAKS